MSLTIFTKSPIFDVWQGSEMWKCEMLLILPLKNCESRKNQTTALSMITCLGFPQSVFSFIYGDWWFKKTRRKKNFMFHFYGYASTVSGLQIQYYETVFTSKSQRVPGTKGSMVGPVFFNVYLDFFVCIRKVSAYNFADDSILSSFAKSVKCCWKY